MKRIAAAGFTLIELLVVIAIITVLATLVAPRLLKGQKAVERTACLETLHDLYAHFIDYETLKGQLPEDSGPAFVYALWGHGLSQSENNAEAFFCRSTGHKPPKDWKKMNDRANLGAPGGFMIDYAGRNQKDPNYRVLKRTVEGAEDLAIVSDLVTPGMAQKPHANEGICVLFLGGATKFYERTDKFGPEQKLIIGEESPCEPLKGLTAEVEFKGE